MTWTLYILECADKTLYTGITSDLKRRMETHESGKGAKYVRSRSPFRVIYTEAHPDRSSASKREAFIKSMDRTEKLALCKNYKG